MDNSEIHPGMRAAFDRELSTALDVLLRKAAEHDGKDLIEANADLMNEMLASFSVTQLAAAASALALQLHRIPAGRD